MCTLIFILHNVKYCQIGIHHTFMNHLAQKKHCIQLLHLEAFKTTCLKSYIYENEFILVCLSIVAK